MPFWYTPAQHTHAHSQTCCHSKRAWTLTHIVRSLAWQPRQHSLGTLRRTSGLRGGTTASTRPPRRSRSPVARRCVGQQAGGRAHTRFLRFLPPSLLCFVSHSSVSLVSCESCYLSPSLSLFLTLCVSVESWEMISETEEKPPSILLNSVVILIVSLCIREEKDWCEGDRLMSKIRIAKPTCAFWS